MFALRRAQLLLYQLRRAGFHNGGAPLAFQYRLACANVFCHFDTVSMLAGAERSAAMINGIEKVVGMVLRAITAAPRTCSREGLEVESGTWDQDTRIRMLLLRFCTKLSCSPADSTIRSALWLSSCAYLSTGSSKGVRSVRLSFAARAFESAMRFWPDISDRDRLLVNSAGARTFADFVSGRMQPAMALVVLQREARVDSSVSWISVDVNDADFAGQRLRLISSCRRAFRIDYVTHRKVTVWEFPAGTVIRDALLNWNPHLHEASFATLRALGNYRRRTLLRAKCSDWAKPGSSHRDFVPFFREPMMRLWYFLSDACLCGSVLSTHAPGQ